MGDAAKIKMQDWVVRAMQRWPNVPALFGWLGLDRRGRWLVKGEVITHGRIVSTINQNYSVDAHGRWYFQNGPQRGYIELEYAPLVLRTDATNAGLVTHTGLPVQRAMAAYLDEAGSVLLQTEHGAGEIAHSDLDWVLQRLTVEDRTVREDELVGALVMPTGSTTELFLDVLGTRMPVIRVDSAEAPARLRFVRDPQPREGEAVSTRAMD